MSTIQLYIIIVRCEQRDGPPRPSAHHVTGRLKNNDNCILCFNQLLAFRAPNEINAFRKQCIHMPRPWVSEGGVFIATIFFQITKVFVWSRILYSCG